MITLAPRARAAPKMAMVQLDQIDFRDDARPTHADKVRELANSIRLLGLQSAPTVVERDGRYRLVAGRHRVEALRIIGRDSINVRVVDFDDIEARLWSISENLHRNELNALQRAEQVSEWARLTEEKAAQVAQVSSAAAQPEKVAQVAPVYVGGRGNTGGVRAASRELGIDRNEVRRSVQIDSLTPAAKEAAREAGLDRNQSALLKVASYADEDQVAAVSDIAKARAEKAVAPRAPVSPKPSSLRNLENLAAGEFARWIKLTTPNDRTRVIRMLRECAAILEDELEATENANIDALSGLGIETEARHG
jgi:ParB-like chromosome segregation protein Spo0J